MNVVPFREMTPPPKADTHNDVRGDSSRAAGISISVSVTNRAAPDGYEGVGAPGRMLTELPLDADQGSEHQGQCDVR